MYIAGTQTSENTMVIDPKNAHSCTPADGKQNLASVHDTNDLHMFLHIHIDLNNQHSHAFILKSPHVHGGKKIKIFFKTIEK